MITGRSWTRVGGWLRGMRTRPRRTRRPRHLVLVEAEGLEVRQLLAARSVDVTFVNITPYNLNFVRGDISHGVWSTLPPSTIAPFSTVQFGSESDGILTGTEAEEIYQIEFTGQEVGIHWNNPYVGSNSYNEWAPAGFKIVHLLGEGNNAQVLYVLSMIDDDGSFAPDVWEYRSYTGTFTNNTGSPLVLDTWRLRSSRWLPGQTPPDRIEVGQTVTWAARSNFFPVRTAGEIVYSMAGTPFRFQMEWEVPADGIGFPLPGDNEFGVAVPAGWTVDVSGANDALDARVSYNARIVDTDGDGIPDEWESNGINVNGTVFRLANANPLRKDLYVEVDAMSQDLDGNGFLNVTNELAINRDYNLDGEILAGTEINENLAPNAGVLQAVAAAFAAAPVSNPDGSTGITLHFDGGAGLDDGAIALVPWGSSTNANIWPNLQATKATWFGTASERARSDRDNLLRAKAMVYRYSVFAYNQGATTRPGPAPGDPPVVAPNTSSGLADGSNDFTVTLGLWGTSGGTTDEQAGTFFHELGHTLGLGHGGGDGINWKPNYHSLMNYLWQVPLAWMATDPDGAARTSIWNLDLSRRALPTLEETGLDETKGIQGTPGLWTRIGPFNTPESVWETGNVDWNHRDGNAQTSVPADPNHLGDVNGDGVTDSADATPGQSLKGFDDWANLVYNVRTSGDFLRGQDDPSRDGPHTEMTYELFQVLNLDTATQLATSLNPSTYGQAVTLTAVVTAYNSQAVTAGLVEFFDGAALLGTAAVAGGAATITTTRLTAGTHTLTARYGGDGSLQPSTSAPLSQLVNRAPLTVTAADATRTYGDPNPILVGTVAGLQNDDNITATYSTTATQASDVGSYPITATLADPDGRLPNYDVTFLAGELVITKAHLTVTADDKTKIFRGPNPPLTATITGFKLEQTLATSGVTGEPALSTTATAESPVGTYPITVAIGTLASRNYDFPTFVPGTLSITYAIRVVSDLSRPANPNSTIPVRIAIEDYYGNNVSAANIRVRALFVTPEGAPGMRWPVQSPGVSQADDFFRFTGGTYHFNLSNRGRAAGAYRLYFAVDGDPLVHSVGFVLN